MIWLTTIRKNATTPFPLCGFYNGYKGFRVNTLTKYGRSERERTKGPHGTPSYPLEGTDLRMKKDEEQTVQRRRITV